MTEREKELKACPFCGKPMVLDWQGPGANEIRHDQNAGTVCRITVIVHTWHEEVAIKAWNTRAEGERE